MFEVMGRLWAAITGRNGKQQEKAAKQEQNKLNKENAKNITNAKNILNIQNTRNTRNTQNMQDVQCDGEPVSRPARRQYAGRLPICAGCMNIGGCAGFFPGCGCYGSSHDTVKVSAGDWHGQKNFSRGSSMASPEFAAWCAFMGYAVAERYWAEYEDVWNYYEEALHEYGSEYEFFDEYADAEQYGDEYAYEFPDESADDGSYGDGDDYEPDAGDRDSYSTYDDDYDYSCDDD
ncbi:MAG: hypothetical protein ACI3U2_07220 [Anaerovibrio sp.]